MYDLHSHTYYSDGTDSPSELIANAASAGIELLGVTDHDTMAGIPEAITAAAEHKLPLLCGAEIEAAFSEKLHILGLGVDPQARCIREMLSRQAERRQERNERMLDKLAQAGYDVRHCYIPGRGCTTRTHVAAALVRAGFAKDTADAFRRLIGRSSPLFVACEHPTMAETVACINEAGGVAVIAHPCKMRCDHAELIRELADCGLWGVEAYYPGFGEETTEYFVGLAKRFGLHVTCGSDYHGGYRPGSPLGCAWRDAEELAESYSILKELAI